MTLKVRCQVNTRTFAERWGLTRRVALPPILAPRILIILDGAALRAIADRRKT